jgi:hypothetical protein
VWNADDKDHASTLEVDANGNVSAHDDGVVIAAAGTRWRLRTTSHKRTLPSCDQIDGHLGGQPNGGAEDGTLVELVPEAGGTPFALDARPAEADAQDELTWTASLLASYGPYVFVQTYESAYGCGAHGGEDYEAHAIDLSTRAELAAPKPDDDLAAQVAEQLQVVDAAAQLAEWIPAWTAGVAHLRELYEVDTCYACGNGLWSSYTSAAWIDGGDLPPPLDALPPVPHAVAALAQGAHAGISWGP